MWRNLIIVMIALQMAFAADAAEKTRSSGADPAIAVVSVDPQDMSQVPRLVRRVLALATAKAGRGEHEDAVATLGAHLRDYSDQDHYLVRFQLARSYDALEKYPEARSQYEFAVALEPRLAAGWFGLGHVNYALGAHAAAGEAFLRSFRADSDPQPQTLYFAAAGYLVAGDPQAAAPLLSELCSGHWGEPRHEWYAQLASCAISLEQRDLAAAALETYVARYPSSAEAWYLKYQFDAGFAMYREAAIALAAVGYMRPLTNSERRTLGDLFSLIDVPALAAELYSAAIAEEAKAEDFERLASALVAAHDLDLALAALQAGLRAHPTLRLWSLLGDVHYLRKDFTAAAAAFTKVAELDPDSGRALLMIGYCHLEQGNRGLAIQHLVAAARFEDQADLAERLLMRARMMART